MSQVDYTINSNEPIVNARTDIMAFAQAILTQNSGNTAPVVKYEGMFWADTTNNLLKQWHDPNWLIISELNKVGNLSVNAGNPNGAITGLYEGQILFDTSNNIPWYYSGSSTSWFTSNGTTSLAVTKTANYTALTTDSIILCNATSGNITITLYTAVGNAGRKLTIIKTDSSTNTVTIDGNSTETINGALTQVLFTQHSTLTLVSNGTNWQIENGQLNRVLLNETVVSSAVASVNFTSLITSTFKKYTIELINIISVTNDVNLLLRTSSNNGSSWDAGTGYSTQGLLVASTTATNSISLSNTAYSAILLTLDAATGRLANSATQGGLSCTIDLYNPSSTTAIKHFKHLTSYAPSGTTSYTIYGGGTRQTTTAVNAVQIICSSGNIASGTLKLYGEN